MKIQVRNPGSLKWISKVEFALAGFCVLLEAA